MMIKLLRLSAFIFIAGCAPAYAAEMEITASFSPSMSNPENNTFTNTTPQGGYCSIWPNYCGNNIFSIGIPIIASITKDISAKNEPRDGVYFKLPGKPRQVKVLNEETGEYAFVTFNTASFGTSARFPTAQNQRQWNTANGTLSYPSSPSPCKGLVPGVGHHLYMAFLWGFPAEDVACYAISNIDRTEPATFDAMAIGYVLNTPDPLKMSSGIYKGALHFTVGPGGDFDFGDNYQASDNNLTINFTLTVNHELKLTTTAEDRQVTLQPCAPGRVCTEEEGKANWERSTITRIAPQLTGRSNFSLSSSGAFTVFLQCGQQLGQDCALQSERSAKQVPVQALLTLPDNIVDQHTGSKVTQKKLRVGKDITQNVFHTMQFGQDRKGSIDFVVAQKDVENMLKTRPDNYTGTVTVIFDPMIY